MNDVKRVPTITEWGKRDENFHYRYAPDSHEHERMGHNALEREGADKEGLVMGVPGTRE
jgi:hypothetical protein